MFGYLGGYIMLLYAENSQSVTCSKADRPKFRKGDAWRCTEALVDNKLIKMYSSDRYQYPMPADDYMGLLGGSGKGFYLYFQLESQWYKMDAYQEIRYLGKNCLDLTEYIQKCGTFTTQRWNQCLDGVELSDIAQIALLSETLGIVASRINMYNSNIEVYLRDGRLVLINKLERGYEIPY